MVEPKVEQVKQILKQYLEDKMDIYHVAEKIVDLLYPWESCYAPFLSYHLDPWRARADDILYVEDLLDKCAEIDQQSEEYIQCVLSELFKTDP
jgi:hypothetical protein